MRVAVASRRTPRVEPSAKVTWRRRSAKILFSFVLLAFAAPGCFSQRARPVPRLRSGQILFYRLDINSSRRTQTESRVSTSQLPSGESLNASALLQVEVVGATASGFRLKTYYSERKPVHAGANESDAESGSSTTADKLVELTIATDGGASQIKGFDQLSPAQQFAWNDWLGRFTSPMTYPRGGIHPGQKWETSEPETAASPIAGLVWAKKSQYVHDESCPVPAENQPKSSANNSAATPESCAVILVRATLRQKSSPKNSTPQDYKLRNLRTYGSAVGQNESIFYISRVSGLLVRSTEDAQQSMDVIVELADGSNQVHNRLEAKSHSEILLLSATPQSAR